MYTCTSQWRTTRELPSCLLTSNSTLLGLVHLWGDFSLNLFESLLATMVLYYWNVSRNHYNPQGICSVVEFHGIYKQHCCYCCSSCSPVTAVPRAYSEVSNSIFSCFFSCLCPGPLRLYCQIHLLDTVVFPTGFLIWQTANSKSCWSREIPRGSESYHWFLLQS